MTVTKAQMDFEVLLLAAERDILWHARMCEKLKVSNVQSDGYFGHFTNKVTGTTAKIWQCQEMIKGHSKGENLMSKSQYGRWTFLLDQAADLGFWH